MFSPDLFHAGSSPMGQALPVAATILHEVTLGVHHLLLNSDQSIELMRAEQEASEPVCVLHFDAAEAYRLMQCLNELFKQTTHG